jgi:putative N6-adenine-specific DNA methylase
MLKFLLVCIPGLEPWLAEEAAEKRFSVTGRIAGGIECEGNWPDIWRANFELRGASRVLVRLGEFHANHLAQLDKKARAFPWDKVLKKGVPVSVEATCRKSKIYHSGAAAQRIATAITDELGASISDDATVAVKLRIDNNLCTISLDTSGGLLHKRGHKQAMAKAPMRETMAALMLRACGYKPGESVVDPLCGSGTFVIEAAEMSLGLKPGRDRNFAFEHLKTFDDRNWHALKSAAHSNGMSEQTDQHPPSFLGSDRDAGAIKAATENAVRAGVSTVCSFERKAISDAAPPHGPPGLVIMNPPYGTRIGEAKKLEGLYAAIGQVMRERFAGWRVGLVTSNDRLAKLTGIPWEGRPVAILHGGLRVGLYRAKT